MARASTASPREQRRAADRARRRQDTIAAAAEVFAEKGFHAAQMTEIAARAELSRASLYALFEGKEEVYAAVVESAARAVRAVVQARVARLDDAGERLLELIDALCDCFEAHQNLLRIYVRGTQGMPFRVRQEMGDRSVAVFHEFGDWVAELALAADRAGRLGGLAPRTVATALVGAVTLTVTDWIETEPERPLSQAAASLRPLFARALGMEGVR